MAFYLVYEPCADCEVKNCIQCRQTDRQLTLRAVQAAEPPANSINGPCETPQDLLDRMVRFFAFDEATGVMYFKVRQEDEEDE